MHTPDTIRNRFSAGDLDTASGPRIVVMCFDRLDRDLRGALDAIERRDPEAANATLGHAQDLLGELAMMLDVEAWEHAGSLLSVYDYLLRVLALANVHKSAALVREAADLVTELGDGFRGALAATTPNPAAPAATLPSARPAAGRFEQGADSARLSVKA